MSKGSNRRPGVGFADGWERTFKNAATAQADDGSILQELAARAKRDRVIALANAAIRYADENGLVLAIERVSHPPLAMGNHGPVVTVWEKRKAS